MDNETALRLVTALEALSTRLGLQETNSALAAVHAKEQALALQQVSQAVAGVPQLVKDAQTVLKEVAEMRRDFNKWVDSEANKTSDVRRRLSNLESNGQRNA